MKKLMMAMLALAPLAAFAQSPLLTVLANTPPQTSDEVMAMQAGFLSCNPTSALPRSLAARGVRFADSGQKMAPGSLQTLATVVVKPQPQLSSPSGAGGFQVAGAKYVLKRPVKWADGLFVTAVSQVTYFEIVPGSPPLESLSLTFNVDAGIAIKRLDAMSGGRVSSRLGEQFSSTPLYFVRQPDGHELTCYRKPDVQQ